MDTLSTQDFGVFLDMNQWDFQGPPPKDMGSLYRTFTIYWGSHVLGSLNQPSFSPRLTVQAVDAEDGAAAAAGVRP